MKIISVHWQGYALPFKDEFRTSRDRANLRHGLLLRVRTDSGITGLGEGSPVGPSSLEEVHTAAGALEKTAPDWQGREVEELLAGLEDSGLPAPPRFGLETALLDIQGKSTGHPLAVHLGGRPAAVPVNALITVTSPEKAAAAAAEAVANGFTTLKLKVGILGDEALVAAVREAIGPEIKLRLDPNMAWDTETAIEAINRFSKYDIEYVEQPVTASDFGGLAAVRKAVSVPLAADESLTSIEDFRRLLAAGAADVFILKPARLGGLRVSLAIAAAVKAAGKTAVVTTSLESSAGIAACAHLASVVDNDVAHGLGTASLFEAEFTSPRLLPVRGFLQTPTAPGLGISADDIPPECRTDVTGSTPS